MDSKLTIKRWNIIISLVLRLLLVGFVVYVLSGIKVPFVLGDKTSFVILIHIGVAVSLASNWRFIIGLKWTDPINIVGSILGAAAVLVIIFAIKDIDVPFVSGYRAAFQVLAVLLLLKVGLKILQDRKTRRAPS